MKRNTRLGKVFVSVSALALSASSAASYVAASPDAFKSATVQMEALDKVMTDGVKVLQSGDLTAIGAHSERIASLVASGKSIFGASILEPLGRCSAAGIHAQSWWREQVRAAQAGGVESVPGSIQSALSEYQTNRSDCLSDAKPIAKAEQASNKSRRECLTVFDVDPETKEITEKPKPPHCKG
ncbi:hypothetical protein [Pseudomonas moorei]|uniref:hypothetical protein n=1 Tax=Pseudomonas moorei TaxID=395599 RepID=UPI00201084CD|nr:hypothetical protein [Pseudomonas moorei]